MKITEYAIVAVATAMAKVNHIGSDPIPDRDVQLYHERAKLFLAAAVAIQGLRPSALGVDSPPPSPEAEVPNG